MQKVVWYIKPTVYSTIKCTKANNGEPMTRN